MVSTPNSTTVIAAAVIIIFLLAIYICSKSESEDKTIPSENLEISIKTINIESDLFHTCPCSEGYKCDSGVCKLNDGERCLTTTSCGTESFCFNGICTPKPNKMEEISAVTNKYFELYGEDKLEDGSNAISRNVLGNSMSICSCGQPMFLNGDRFIIMPGWWTLSDTVSICESVSFENVFYTVNKLGHIYSLSLDKNKVQRIMTNINVTFCKLIKIDQQIYGLTYDGEIHILQNENKRTWKWDISDVFFGNEIINSDIQDIIVSRSTMCIISKGGTFILSRFNDFPKTTWKKICDNPVDKISLHNYNNSTYIIVIETGKGIIYKYDEDNLNPIVKFIGQDAELDPNSTEQFYIIDNNNEVMVFKINNRNMNNITVNRITGALASNLFKIGKKIWITTSQQCLSI